MFGSEDRKIQEREQRAQGYTQQDMTLNAGLKEDAIDLSYAQKLAEDNQRYSEDFEDEKIEALDRSLRNHIKNSRGEWVPRKIFVGYTKEGKKVYEEVPPKLNDQGIQDIISIAQPYFHRNMINGNISEDDKNFMLWKTKRILRHNLISKRILYGFGNNPSIAHLRMIIDLVLNHIKPTPTRAVNDGERRHKRQYVKKLEATFEGSQKPKNKTWGVI